MKALRIYSWVPLAEFLNNLSKLQILKIWNKDKPALVLINGNIIKTNGKENKNLPAYAIIIAKTIDKIIVINLIPFDIFLLDVFTNQLSKI